MAGAHAQRLGHHARRDRRPADPAGAAARPLRRGRRRPRRQAPADGRPAGRHGTAGADPRRAHDQRRGDALGGGPAGRPAGPQQRLRVPRPAGVHARDGRPGHAAQRRQPQLGARQRRPRDRPRAGRHPDRAQRRGRVLPDQCRQFRRCDRLAADPRPRRHQPQRAQPAEPRAAARGTALRRRRPRTGGAAGDDGAGRRARLRVPGDAAGDGQPGAARRRRGFRLQ